MADEEDTIKIELEVPKDQLKISGEGSSEEESAESDEKSSGSEGEGEGKAGGEKSVVTKVTGYKSGELAKIPIEPPEVESARKPLRGQVRTMIIGFVLVAASLIAWPIFGFRVAIAVVIVGAVFIAVGVLVRL